MNDVPSAKFNSMQDVAGALSSISTRILEQSFDIMHKTNNMFGSNISEVPLEKTPEPKCLKDFLHDTLSRLERASECLNSSISILNKEI